MDLIPRVIASAEQLKPLQLIGGEGWITSLIFQINLETELCAIKTFVSLHNKKLSLFITGQCYRKTEG